jgi:LPS O-antigen subunit length determinant protein (WzzB/FepE family)
MKHYSTLSAEVARKELENIELKKSLTVKGAEFFVQQPSVPYRKISPRRSMVVLVALLASGVALLLFVFIRTAWRNAIQDAASATKVAYIKSLLGLG